MDHGSEWEATYSFLLPKTSPISDQDSKTQKEYTHSDTIRNIPDPAELYCMPGLS